VGIVFGAGVFCRGEYAAGDNSVVYCCCGSESYSYYGVRPPTSHDKIKTDANYVAAITTPASRTM
jgi:hypothetical protein